MEAAPNQRKPRKKKLPEQDISLGVGTETGTAPRTGAGAGPSRKRVKHSSTYDVNAGSISEPDALAAASSRLLENRTAAMVATAAAAAAVVSQDADATADDDGVGTHVLQQQKKIRQFKCHYEGCDFKAKQVRLI